MKRYLIFVLYVTVSLLIGREFHPFSTFPMYNSFPNWGYVFLLKNEKGEIIPYGGTLADGRQKNSGYVGHTFDSYMEAHHYPYGDGREDSTHMQEAGAALMKMILQGEDPRVFHTDTLKLYRRYYYLNNEEELKYRDDLMYEKAL